VNLEFDLQTGKRGDRQDNIRDHLSALCGSESALVVNNNAAAVMLAINEIAQGGEVIVSRGQLVEIGGSFRIPDIIEKSGAILKEVGTTNRTHSKDYGNAISNKTKLILWVHTSNYVVRGFTRSVPLSELVALGKKHKIPVMVDWGSGALLDMNSLNLADEIPVKTIMENNPDLLTFSGDKLIGGPQSGLIIGKKTWVNTLQNNPLYRVLRCDKITIGLLEETLRSYRSDSFTKDNLSLSMLTTSRRILKNRGQRILDLQKRKKIKDLGIKLVESEVEAGSGSLPEDKIESMALSFKPKSMKITELAGGFRCGSIPVVGYTSGHTFYIDLKAVLPGQINRLAKAIDQV
jgi:L-seryl-tRNA(Ser) seleniumtransferase